jgi:AcrR family transcriptional regulator
MANNPSDKRGKSVSPRRSKKQWLEQSLAILAEQGTSQIRIDELAQALGVTKGSFYHHFIDRADLVRSAVQYWDAKYTREIGTKLAKLTGTPQEKLWLLMQAIVDEDLTRYDVAIRALASREPKLRRLIKKADQFRLATVRSLFSDMGFTNSDLESRTRAFVTTMSFEDAIFDRMPAPKRKKLLRAEHRFFTRP